MEQSAPSSGATHVQGFIHGVDHAVQGRRRSTTRRSSSWSNGRSRRARTGWCRWARPARARRSATRSTSASSSCASKTAKKRVPVIAGAGSNSTDEAIDLTRHAKKAGADAVLHSTGYYNKPTQEGLYRHFKAISEAVDIPIFLYNVPVRTIVDIQVATMARCAKLEERRRRQGRHRQRGARHAAAPRLRQGLHPALGRGRHRARLHGAWRPWLHLGDLQRGAAPVRRVPERLPQGRLRRRRSSCRTG